MGQPAIKQHEAVPRHRYVGPQHVERTSLQELIRSTGRSVGDDRQFDMLREGDSRDAYVYYAGNLEFLNRCAVSIVGTRDVSDDGARRAARLARELAREGVLVVSGLAMGVDTAALTAAIHSGGRTAAVIGTPIEKAYPAENAELQEQIYREHLLISPFRQGEPVYRSNFPKRNRVMALLSDATVIVEASDTSGTLHQAAECQKRGRWLCILKSVAEDPKLSWPARFIGKPFVKVVSETEQILALLK